jgi:hypothetical protein
MSDKLEKAFRLTDEEHAEAQGGSLESTVEEIIGKTSAQENAAEFLKEAFAIESHELPLQDSHDEAECSVSMAALD